MPISDASRMTRNHCVRIRPVMIMNVANGTAYGRCPGRTGPELSGSG
jgi:hypothetical protein